MCLTIFVEAPATGRELLEQAARAASEAGLPVRVTHPARWTWARQEQARASISEDASCACSLLSDNADWSAETWAMRPDVLEPLGRTLEILAEQGPSPLIIQALWVGESATQEIRLSGAELANLARHGRLGTRTRYVVERRAPQ